MTTTYLDKEVVLKALYDDDGKERQYEYCSELKERIEHGEFDARAVSRTFTEAYQAGIYTAKKALADKDAEIADLEKKNIGAHEIIKEKHAEIERLIEKYNEAKAAPHYPDGPWDKLHKAVAENRNLRDRIADLEKLCDMQKATIDQQGIEIEQKNKILQSRMDEIGELYEKIRAQDQDQEYLKKMLQCANDGLEQTAQKEPELFVCPFGKECRNGGCYHKEPHPKEHKCTIKCARYDTFDIKCIPVKEPVLQPSPVPTSGTGTAPEGATVEQEQPESKVVFGPTTSSTTQGSGPGDRLYLEYRNLKGEHGYMELTAERLICLTAIKYIPDSSFVTMQYRGEDFAELIDVLTLEGDNEPDDGESPLQHLWECVKDIEESTYSGMAKDIGDLTLRVDNLEEAFDILTEHTTPTLLNDQVQALSGQVEELQKALKALQEEVKGTSITGENGTTYSLKVKRVL